MKVLIVDGFRRHDNGRKAWNDFYTAIISALGGTAAHEVSPPDVHCCTLSELESQYCCDATLFDGAYGRAEAGRRFDARRVTSRRTDSLAL